MPIYREYIHTWIIYSPEWVFWPIKVVSIIKLQLLFQNFISSQILWSDWENSQVKKDLLDRVQVLECNQWALRGKSAHHCDTNPSYILSNCLLFLTDLDNSEVRLYESREVFMYEYMRL